ncbi:lysophospholipid acyltransferase family protein, partial [Pseudomonas aeruginosa]
AGDRGLWSKVVAWFLRAVEQVPLDRSGGRTSVNAMGSVERRLAEGGLVGIFPEGTRSSDGRLYKGKTGVARMTLGSGAPVVPVG